MRANKENIIAFLKEIKPELQNYGIKNITLCGIFVNNNSLKNRI